jgi:hypothetical protein
MKQVREPCRPATARRQTRPETPPGMAVAPQRLRTALPSAARQDPHLPDGSPLAPTPALP